MSENVDGFGILKVIPSLCEMYKKLISSMGGKRDLKRCVSLMDDPQHLSPEFLWPPSNLHPHGNTHNPQPTSNVHNLQPNGNNNNLQPHSNPHNLQPNGNVHNLQPNVNTHNNQPHGNTFCPVTIHIDECSDNDEAEHNNNTPNPKHPDKAHVTHPSNQSPPFHHPVQITVTSAASDSPSSSPSLSRRSSPNFLEIPEKSELSDLSVLKATAVRLKLRTRTSSFLEWQALWLDKARLPPPFPQPPALSGDERHKEALTLERKERINHALGWLKTELKEMQHMDQHLARQLLSLRHDIHQLRLRRSCQQHRDLLDDVTSELEEQEELSDVLDLPRGGTSLHDTPLKQLGVTRMNLSARRFSTC